jgi:hypothetical protein
MLEEWIGTVAKNQKKNVLDKPRRFLDSIRNGAITILNFLLFFDGCEEVFYC